MGTDSDFFAIAVFGSMNPSIHHPSWYRRAGLIDANAERIAISDQNLVCSPQLSRFGTDAFEVECAPEMWRVESVQDDSLDNLERLACRTFDEKLPETPIGRVGFSFAFHRVTLLPNVAVSLAECMNTLPLGLKPFGSQGASFIVASVREAQRASLRVEPSSKSQEMVYIELNYNYDAPAWPGDLDHFEIRSLLSPSFRADLEEAATTRDTIISSLNLLDPRGKNAPSS